MIVSAVGCRCLTFRQFYRYPLTGKVRGGTVTVTKG